MDNPVKHILQLIFDHYIDILIGMIFTPTLIYLWKWFQSKEDEVREHRIRFFIGAGIFGAIATTLLLSAIAQMRPTEKIGKLSAGVIFAGPTGASVYATNVTAGTYSGGGNITPTVLASGFNMVFIVRVSNSESRTTAWNWKVKLSIPNASDIDCVIPSVSSITAGTIVTAFGPYTISMDNNIMQKLATIGVDAGGAEQGWLLVHVPGLKEPPLGSKFIISFEDAWGQKTTFEDVWLPPFNGQ